MRSRRERSITHDGAAFSHDLVKRSPLLFPENIESMSQTAVSEPVQCEERRQVGTQILIEKGQAVDSLSSRFVGNLIAMFSNRTASQEVSRSGLACKYYGADWYCGEI